jgi:hypothetical protein
MSMLPRVLFRRKLFGLRCNVVHVRHFFAEQSAMAMDPAVRRLGNSSPTRLRPRMGHRVLYSPCVAAWELPIHVPARQVRVSMICGSLNLHLRLQ